MAARGRRGSRKGPRVLVCGGRQYEDRDALFRALDALEEEVGRFGLVIAGGAVGADSFAAEWALERGRRLRVFEADWETHGRAAGPLRNIQMLEEGRPDLVVAFPGLRGTAHMVGIAGEVGVRVRMIGCAAGKE